MPFDFDEEMYQRLEALVEDSGSASKAEVVRRALRLYEWLLKKADEDRSIIVTSSDGAKTEGPYNLDLLVR